VFRTGGKNDESFQNPVEHTHRCENITFCNCLLNVVPGVFAVASCHGNNLILYSHVTHCNTNKNKKVKHPALWLVEMYDPWSPAAPAGICFDIFFFELPRCHFLFLTLFIFTLFNFNFYFYFLSSPPATWCEGIPSYADVQSQLIRVTSDKLGM
jgi:hypothetical protein